MRKLCFYLFLIGIVAVVAGCQKKQDSTASPNITLPKTTQNYTGTNENRYIDFENSTLSSTDYSLTDNGYTCAFITKGTYSNPQLTTAEFYKGATSIVYQMPHTTVSGSVTNDKSQHRIFSGSETIAMGFDDKRYYGFAVKLDALTEQPTAACQLFQIWQGTPMSPPVELSIIPGGTGDTFDFKLDIRNNNTTANPSADVTVYSGTIQRGVWNTFVLMAIMCNTTDTQNGELKLWLNATQVLDWFGRAGYADGIVYAGTPYTPNAKFDTFFGPYRPCQAANIKMYYDQVRYATTYAAANPDQ
jgi:hypothetical protein